MYRPNLLSHVADIQNLGVVVAGVKGESEYADGDLVAMSEYGGFHEVAVKVGAVE